MLRRYPPMLDSFQRRILLDLKTYGIAVAHIDDFMTGVNALVRLHAFAKHFIDDTGESFRNQPQGGRTKVFLTHFWKLKPPIDIENPFVRFALEERILGVVNSYLGMHGNLYYLTLAKTRPMSMGADAVSSQRWHRDPEDRRQCKVFLYLTDVGAQQGPFTYVKKSTRGNAYGALCRQKPPIGFYPDDGHVEKAVKREDIFEAMGKAGTIIFAETTGLHRGGYAISGERVMFTAGYRSRASVTPSKLRYTPDMQEEITRNLGNVTAYAAIPNNPSRLSMALYSRFKKLNKRLKTNVYYEG